MLSLYLASTARAQAELDSGCISRLPDLAQDETNLENKQFHFEYSNVCGSRGDGYGKVSVLASWYHVRIAFRVIPVQAC